MKNIEQILTELGIPVPDDKKDDLAQAVGENYRTIVDYRKVAAKLDGFKDVDLDDLKEQISTLTTQLNNERAARQNEAALAALQNKVNTFLGGKKFVNQLTEKSIRESLMSELGKDTARGRSIEDIFAELTSDKDGNAMENILVDEKAEAGAARFTTGITGQGGGATMTKKDILAIKDSTERQSAIAQHLHLFNKGE